MILIIVLFPILITILIAILVIAHPRPEPCLADERALEERDGLLWVIIEAHPLQAAHRLVTVDGEDKLLFGLAGLGELNLIEGDVDALL